jgi:hypothetical protein
VGLARGFFWHRELLKAAFWQVDGILLQDFKKMELALALVGG